MGLLVNTSFCGEGLEAGDAMLLQTGRAGAAMLHGLLKRCSDSCTHAERHCSAAACAC